MKRTFKAWHLALGLGILAALPVTLGSYTMNEPDQQGQTGTISGKVLYKGGKVHKTKDLIKDEKTCGSDPIVDKSIVAHKGGELKWAVVSISSEVENGKSMDKLPGDAVLNQEGCEYQPHVVLVGVNEPLVVKNSDKTLHNVRSVSMLNQTFNTTQPYIPGQPQPADTTRFSEPEVVKMVCDVHGWMKSYVHVVKHPYHDVTREDGQFSLTEVPPGTYELTVWHETLGEKTKEVKVKAGKTSNVQFKYAEK